MLSEALWAHRISRHGATKVTPFELVYGQGAVLSVEVNLDAYRLAKQNDLSAVDYHDLMMDNIDEVTDCNTRFIKGHKPSNHIRARIKSHVYTTE